MSSSLLAYFWLIHFFGRSKQSNPVPFSFPSHEMRMEIPVTHASTDFRVKVEYLGSNGAFKVFPIK